MTKPSGPRAHQPTHLTRRSFLRMSAIATAAGISVPALLAACAKGDQAPAAVQARAILAGSSAQNPVTLPIYEDNPPAPSGLPIEDGATLKVYQFKEYLSPDVLDSFEKAYRAHDISVETTSYDTIDEALGIIGQPGADFDVFFPSVESLGPLVQERMLRPLNHEYLHNCGNLWPQFTGTGAPFFDREMRYATPYTVYTTGVSWRDDMLGTGDDPSRAENPYDVLWDPRYEGQVSIYDSPREALAMAMLHNGVTDINGAGPRQIDDAVNDLLAMNDSVGLSLVGEGTYEGLVDGVQAVRQAWSGDALSARRYALAEKSREEREAGDQIRYHWQPGGIVGVDLTAILSQGMHPVLAHAFLDHLMDDETAIRNFAWNGYQPATRSAVPSQFQPGARWDWITGPDLANAVVSPEQWSRGIMLMELEPDDEAQWLAGWNTVRAAAQDA